MDPYVRDILEIINRKLAQVGCPNCKMLFTGEFCRRCLYQREAR